MFLKRESRIHELSFKIQRESVVGERWGSDVANTSKRRQEHIGGGGTQASKAVHADLFVAGDIESS